MVRFILFNIFCFLRNYDIRIVVYFTMEERVKKYTKNEVVVPTAFFSEHFNSRPDMLVEYIRIGLKRPAGVLGTHISQLADLVNLPLKRNGVLCKNLSNKFVNPKEFDNLETIICTAENKFNMRYRMY